MLLPWWYTSYSSTVVIDVSRVINYNRNHATAVVIVNYDHNTLSLGHSLLRSASRQNSNLKLNHTIFVACVN